MYLTKRFSMNQSKNRLYFFLGLLAIYLFLMVATAFAQDVTDTEYRPFPKIGSRSAAWIAAQLHLLFGSFILGVPMFAVVIEFVGMKTKDKRYDKMAQEFIKLCMGAFSTTALLGGVLVFYSHLVLPESDEQNDRNLRTDDDFLRLPVFWRDLYTLSLLLRLGSDAGQSLENVAPISRRAPERVRYSDYVRF